MLNYAFYEKKYCKTCGGWLQKWGKNKSGSQRFRCLKCGGCDTRKRVELTHLNHQKIYEDWLLSKFTLTDFGKKYDVDRRTLNRWFVPFRNQEIIPSNSAMPGEIFIIDGYFVEYAATVLIAQTTTNLVVGWLFTYAENFSTWHTFFQQIRSFPFSIVCDGQKGMLKAIRTRWPGVIIQRCQFHVIHQVNILLTKHPETVAAQDFKQIVGTISSVKTNTDFKQWLTTYVQWYQNNKIFLKQRTYQELLTPTGRPTWHYTHGRLHAAHSHLKNAFPNLFTYIRFPQIPNTTNRIEGGVNAQIQRHIDRHRGTTLFQRRQIIAALLKQKQSQKPTRNVT